MYNAALQKELFPPSWTQTCVTLLLKKGNLSSLRNWRPIALINTDVKIFTWLLNLRLQSVVDRFITPFQTGFMPGGFLADNGMLVKMIMEQQHSLSAPSGIGLLLDSEKAYDQVHEDYLQHTMERFGFPISTIRSIMVLFFATEIQLNINGHLFTPIRQQ